MDISTTQTHESITFPGVRFTVRRLNVIQCAARDAKIVEARERYSELWAQLSKLRDYDGEIFAITSAAAADKRELTEDERKKIEAIEKDPEAESIRARRLVLNHKIGLITNIDLKPAYIRAGLVSIEGLKCDGVDLTPEALLTFPSSELIDEVYVACFAASGLSAEQLKNLQSPSTSEGSEMMSPTTASAASG